MAKGEGGGRATLLLVLLAGLAGAVGWNYHRNTQLAEAAPRPYRSYAEADLERLSAAYRAQMELAARELERATGRKVSVRAGGLIGEQIEEFERVQRISRHARALAARMRENQAALEEVEHEQERRRREADALGLFLERAFTFGSPGPTG